MNRCPEAYRVIHLVNRAAVVTPEKIALRRAMIMGFNTEEMIRVWWQGQALVATQPIPPEHVKLIKDGNGVHAELMPGTFRPVANRTNDYLIDRDVPAFNRVIGSAMTPLTGGRP